MVPFILSSVVGKTNHGKKRIRAMVDSGVSLEREAGIYLEET